MTLPAGFIRTPELDDYCHIDLKYAVFSGPGGSDAARKSLCPSKVTHAQQMYGARLPREVFIPLFEILRPLHLGIEITTPEHLDLLADEVGDVPAHTKDQLRSYDLMKAYRSNDVDWLALADLYNGMTAESRKFVKGFFKYCLDINLRKLMETQGPKLSVPDDLRSKEEALLVDGKRLVNCRLAQAPVHEKHFCRQFTIIVQRERNKIIHFVGSAGTPEVAIAKAWSYLSLPSARFPFPTEYFNIERRRNYPFISKITLLLDGRPLVEGKIEYSPMPMRFGQPLNHHTPFVTDVIWSRALIKTNDPSPHRMTIREFEASLYRAEKALGLTSSKGRHLEDDLGL
jgi:hypothetical protein